MKIFKKKKVKKGKVKMVSEYERKGFDGKIVKVETHPRKQYVDKKKKQ